MITSIAQLKNDLAPTAPAASVTAPVLASVPDTETPSSNRRSELVEAWFRIGMSKPSIRKASDPPFTRDSFRNAEYTDIGLMVDRILQSPYWCVGQPFYWRNVCFIDQVEGGDEWLVIIDEEPVESFSCGRMGKEGVLDAVSHLLKTVFHLRSIDVVPSITTVTWYSDWYTSLTKDHRYHWFLRQPSDLCTRGDNELLWHWGKDFWHWNGRIVTRYVPPSPDRLGLYYHPLRAQGWETANAGQKEHEGICFATTEGLTALLDRLNFPTQRPPML